MLWTEDIIKKKNLSCCYKSNIVLLSCYSCEQIQKSQVPEPSRSPAAGKCRNTKNELVNKGLFQ